MNHSNLFAVIGDDIWWLMRTTKNKKEKIWLKISTKIFSRLLQHRSILLIDDNFANGN